MEMAKGETGVGELQLERLGEVCRGGRRENAGWEMEEGRTVARKG